MKHTFYSLLPLFLLLDLVIPFLLAPTYPGYRHTRQVMSVLGNRSAPFHTVYTLGCSSWGQPFWWPAPSCAPFFGAGPAVSVWLWRQS